MEKISIPPLTTPLVRTISLVDMWTSTQIGTYVFSPSISCAIKLKITKKKKIIFSCRRGRLFFKGSKFNENNLMDV